MQANTAGTLIWIDDDFDKAPFASDDNSELRTWQRTFGQADNRIYRLLNLQLEVATTGDDAYALIDELRRESQDRCVVAVVDLRIPKSSGGDAQAKFGIHVANRLDKLGIPYFILSSASVNSEGARSLELDRSRYFQKKQAPSRTMMPDDLVRRILSTFRNNITWLDLSSIIGPRSKHDAKPLREGAINFDHGHPLYGANEWMAYFPFFGPFRDFIERWEARTSRAQPRRVVLRAAPNVADAFVAQCISVIMSSTAPNPKPKAFWFDSRRPERFFEQVDLINSESVGATSGFDSPVHHVAVRIHGDRRGPDKEFLNRVLETCRAAKLYIVIPQDETADPLLYELAGHGGLVYDDIPGVRPNDHSGRRDLAVRCARFVFQRLRFDVDDHGDARPHPLYLRAPGLLIDPTAWTFLNESDNVSDELNDPVEVIAALGKAAETVRDWPLEDRIALAEGRPPASPARLLKPAAGLFEQMAENHVEWRERALRDWLSESWRSPHNAVRQRDPELPSDPELRARVITAWEDHALRVGFGLASDFLADGARRAEEDDRRSYSALVEAARFLSHPGVRAAVAGELTQGDWSGVESLRWPHVEFAMPVALKRALKRSGRFLWVQTDLLDRATLLHTGFRAIERVEARAERIDRRLTWLAEAALFLPAGWRAGAETVRDVIAQRKLADIWRDPPARLALWNTFFSIVTNATPVSYLFHCAHRASPREISKDRIKKLAALKGQGPAFGVIRDGRANRLSTLFELVEPQSGSWLRSFEEAREHLQFFMSFFGHPAHAPHLKALEQASWALAEQICAVDEALIEKARNAPDSPATTDLLNDLLEAVMASTCNLGGGEFFDADFKPAAPEASFLRFGAMRGLTADILLAGAEMGERLRSLLQPVMYFDGYHLLSLTYDVRCNCAKNSAPGERELPLMEFLLELFLTGFEGLVAQLAWLIAAAGRDDIAAAIPLSRVRVRAPAEPVTKLEEAFIVEGEPGDYRVYALGLPGESVSRPSFDDGRGGVSAYRATKPHAAE